jgi:hypothetical protein
MPLQWLRWLLAIPAMDREELRRCRTSVGETVEALNAGVDAWVMVLGLVSLEHGNGSLRGRSG